MSGDHDDFAAEPVRGLPQRLPEGERLLWQGSPRWWALACEVFHIRAVAGYFVALMAWRAGAKLAEGADPLYALGTGLSLLPLAAGGVGLLALLAAVIARAAVYTITSKRIVMRIGVAFTATFNIPFQAIGRADLRARRAGAGDIVLQVLPPARIGYLHLWPHVRPWRLARPEPMLCGLPDAAAAAQILAAAARAALPAESSPPPLPASPAPQVRGARAPEPALS